MPMMMDIEWNSLKILIFSVRNRDECMGSLDYCSASHHLPASELNVNLDVVQLLNQ
jgi:hypothetical protein